MKQIITIIFILAAFVGKSQLTVKSQQPVRIIANLTNLSRFMISLSYKTSGQDTTYMIVFRNDAYPAADELIKVEFSSKGNSVEALYQLLKSGLSNAKLKSQWEAHFTLGTTECRAETRLAADQYVYFFTPTGYFAMSEKTLDALFKKG